MDGSLDFVALAGRALAAAQAGGATTADVRVGRRRREVIRSRNGQPENIARTDDMGFGVRALVDGAWGFASSPNYADSDEFARVAAEAVRIARASARVRRAPVSLTALPDGPQRGMYRSPVVRDPFAVPLAEKLELLAACGSAMLERAPETIKVAEGLLQFQTVEQEFYSSEGAAFDQTFTECAVTIAANAVSSDGREFQRRSFSNAAQRGYEFVTACDLPAIAPQLADDARALLAAPPCPRRDSTDIVLGSLQMALQVHESCGHPTELDRVLGTEASFAGTSFLTRDRRGSFQYGSPIVNITADSTIAGGLGSFGWDDEGVAAQRFPLVVDGLFVGYQTSRETAPIADAAYSNGTMRAEGWQHLPLIRMTNINLEPAPSSVTVDDLIAGIDDGVYMDVPKSWSLDDKRLNFHFGCEIAYAIKNGKRAGLLKNPTYTGVTPRFWNACDGIAGADAWQLWGLPSCAKGEPLQVAHVSHGASPARFRGVRIGVGLGG